MKGFSSYFGVGGGYMALASAAVFAGGGEAPVVGTMAVCMWTVQNPDGPYYWRLAGCDGHSGRRPQKMRYAKLLVIWSARCREKGFRASYLSDLQV